jgi:hypothetical protein
VFRERKIISRFAEWFSHLKELDYESHLSSEEVVDNIEGALMFFFHLQGAVDQPCRRPLPWLPNDEVLTTSESAS